MRVIGSCQQGLATEHGTVPITRGRPRASLASSNKSIGIVTRRIAVCGNMMFWLLKPVTNSEGTGPSGCVVLATTMIPRLPPNVVQVTPSMVTVSGVATGVTTGTGGGAITGVTTGTTGGLRGAGGGASNSAGMQAPLRNTSGAAHTGGATVVAQLPVLDAQKVSAGVTATAKVGGSIGGHASTLALPLKSNLPFTGVT